MTLDINLNLALHPSPHACRAQDLFAEFYRKRLSRRLLVEKSSAEHHERAVLAQLKQQCGAQFTSKVPDRTLQESLNTETSSLHSC